MPLAQEEPVQEGSSTDEESDQEGSSADVEGSINEEVADEDSQENESSEEDDSFESAEESDSGDEVAFCPVCDKEITYSDNALQCYTCSSWYHIRCCKVTKKRYQELNALGEGVPWQCPFHQLTPKKGTPPGFRTK